MWLANVKSASNKCGARRASTALRCVNYDTETHIVRSSLSIQVPDVTVSEFVWRDAKKREHLPAITCAVSKKTYTYGQAEGASRNFGINIRNQLSLQTGDAIGLVLPNMPEFPVAFLGAASAGLVVSAANPIYTSDELSHQFTAAKVRAVVTTPDLLAKVEQALASTPGGGAVVVTGAGDETSPRGGLSFEKLVSDSTRGQAVPPRPDPAALVALPFSSGTTGKPKGVMLSHRNLVVNLCQLHHDEMFPNIVGPGGSQAKNLALMPMFHIYGLNGLLNLALHRGQHVISLPRFEPQTFVHTIKTYKPNIVCMAPPLVAFMSNSPDLTAEDLSELRVAINGAAPVSLSNLKKLIEKIGSKDLVYKEGYGLTEVSCCASMFPNNSGSDKYGSIGVVAPQAQVKVVDEEGRALPLGEKGELYYKGDNMMLGYLDNPEATEGTMSPDGWLKTGDVAYIDKDGYIFLVDRFKELIKVKGYQVSPTELEEILRTIPELGDVAVVGVADDDAGEVPRAFVVKKTGAELTEKAVKDFLKEKVASFKQLKGGVRFVDAIPRSAAGKILRKELKNLP